MELKILTKENEILRKKSEPIVEITDEIKTLCNDMVSLLKSSEGIGLSAPQIGKNIRLFIINILDESHVFINPEILEKSDEFIISPEKCLSLPGEECFVLRRKALRFCYMDISGEKKTVEVIDYIAYVIQHEIDHLDGILVEDRHDEPLKIEFNRNLEEIKRKKLNKKKKSKKGK